MSEYQIPGVYIEEQSTLGRSVRPVETARPAFIGYTEKAVAQDGSDLTGKAVAVTSMLEYQQQFGGPNSKFKVVLDYQNNSCVVKSVSAEPLYHKMYYSLQMFFANGGNVAWIVSVAPYPEAGANQVAKEKLLAGLAALEIETGITLMAFPDLGSVSSNNLELGKTERGDVLKTALSQCSALKDRFVVMDLADDLATFRTQIGSANLNYGACYTPDLQTSLPWQNTDAQIVFEKAEGVTNATVVALHQMSLAGALASNTPGIQAVLTSAWVADLRAKVNARPGPVLPPCGAVMGAYCANDNTRGVWNAPANIALAAVQNPVDVITDQSQQDLNSPLYGSGKAINAIRFFPGEGTKIWGARTLDANSLDYRYIQVRRTLIYIEQSLKNSLQHYVFEPNDANTWSSVTAMTDSFLQQLWASGGLQGAQASDAYVAACGLGTTMTQEDILSGRLVLQIAVSLIRPAEFILITLTQTVAS